MNVVDGLKGRGRLKKRKMDLKNDMERVNEVTCGRDE